MTWFGQVRHVMLRDIRLLRWAVILFVGVLGIIVLASLGLSPTDKRLSLLPIFVITPFIVAMAVLEDSPAIPDAFWSVQPLRGSAVAVAKVGLLLAICTLAVVASHAVRAAWGLPLEVMSFGGAGTVVGMAAGYIPLVILAAACRTARGFLTTLLLLLAGLFLLGTFGTILFVPVGGSVPQFPPAQAAHSPLPAWAASTVPVLVVVLGSLFLVARYRLPRPGRASAASVIGVTILLTALSRLGGETPQEQRTTEGDLSGTRIAMVAESQPACDRERGWLVVPIEVLSAPGKRIELLAPTLTVTTTDGRRVTGRASGFAQVMGSWGPLLPLRPDGTPWKIVRGTTAPSRAEMAFPLSSTEIDAVCGNVARLVLDIDVQVSEARELARLPLQSGKAVRSPGLRAYVEAAAATPEGVKLSFLIELLARSTARQRSLEHPAYALVDDASGEALADGELTNTTASSMQHLPGLTLSSTGSTTFYVRPSTGASPLPGWAPRATLLVAEVIDRQPMRIHREAALLPAR